jgi:Tol biopolymer transport system component
VDAEGANRQRLTDGTGENLMPYWAADNRVYFISDRGGSECVWSVRAEPGKLFTADAGRGAKREAIGKTDGAAGKTDAAVGSTDAGDPER